MAPSNHESEADSFVDSFRCQCVLRHCMVCLCTSHGVFSLIWVRQDSESLIWRPASLYRVCTALDSNLHKNDPSHNIIGNFGLSLPPLGKSFSPVTSVHRMTIPLPTACRRGLTTSVLVLLSLACSVLAYCTQIYVSRCASVSESLPNWHGDKTDSVCNVLL
jgi:hypothetical protein